MAVIFISSEIDEMLRCCDRMVVLRDKKKVAELNGQETDAFPFPAVLPDAKPVMTAMLGWKCDISGVRKWEDLPEAARNYVEYVEREIGCHITYVSVGPERDSIIIR